MSGSAGLEGLSTETFEAVLVHIPQPSARSILSRVSRRLRDKVAPHLYKSWRYYGGGHSFKSLCCFLRTIVLHQDLAFYVQSVDFREWETSIRHPDGDEKDDCDIQLFQDAIRALHLEQRWTEHFERAIQERNEDVLLALLLTKLPSLQMIFMTMPEDTNLIQNMLELSSNPKQPRILQDLQAIYVCRAMRIGIKGHRQYDLSLEDVLPFFRLAHLPALTALTASPFNRYSDSSDQATQGELLRSSSLAELAFDDAALEIRDVVEALRVPRSLARFRWRQRFSCFSTGSCQPPVFRELGEALAAHGGSLEDLDLDIRHRVCRGDGHAGNPYTAGEDVLRAFRAGRVGQPCLIGSLAGFTALKTLSLDPVALCGDAEWGLAPYAVADGLPSSLEVLRLRSDLNGQAVGQGEMLKKHVWIEKVTEMVASAADKLPILRKIVVVIIYHPWTVSEARGLPISKLEEACRGAGIVFEELTESSESPMTPVPYFQNQHAKRHPGRDW